MIYLLSPLPKEGTKSLPMIDFEQVASDIDYQESELLMFTSKQAVEMAEQIDPNWKKIPTIAIGGATKAKIQAMGGEVIYHPKDFYGEALAKDIKAFFSDKKILYLRPKEVSFDSKAFLEKEGILLREQVIYRTFCRTYEALDQPQKGAVIIFTSPSTIRCFFKSFTWDESYRAVLIGRATAEHLPKECRYVIADTPLIDACVKKAKEIEKDGDI